MRAACLLLVGVIACGPPPRHDGTVDAPGGVPDGSGSADAPIGTTGTSYVYAHTAQELYKVDPDTLALTLVGQFGWPTTGSDQMTDLAIDRDNNMIGISFGAVYRVDPATAAVTYLSTLGGTFNGLSFVPPSAINGIGPDVLIATRNDDGLVFRIDPATGAASQVGNMGSQWQSSGDTVGIENFGVVQTVNGAPWDVLVKLSPGTFTATPIGTNTGFGQIYGIGFWKNQIFGFTLAGDFIKIDAATGVGTLIQHTDKEWYGAAVTTIAPILQ